jgi:hypothetical protein
MDETDERETGATPLEPTDAGADVGPSPEEATAGYRPLESEITAEEGHLFPPDVNPPIEIGGAPEEKGALDEEFRR